MPHLLDPRRLASARDYCAALDELEALREIDAGSPEGWRMAELSALIRDYESTAGTAGLPQAGGHA